MSEPLSTGPFEIYYVIFISPEVEPILKPLGPTRQDDGRVAVVALPQGTKAPMWIVENPAPNQYTFSLEGRFAVPEGESTVVLSNEKYFWRPLRGAPSPPPMRHDGFVVGVGMELSPRWEVNGRPESASAEIPVRLTNDTGTMLFFKSLLRD